MRMSLTSTCGVVVVRARRSTSRALVKLRTGEVFARQRLLQHEADGLVIVDDPDRFHAVLWPQVNASMVQGSGIRILKTVLPGSLSHSISAMVLLHEGLRQRQPQPRAALPPRHQRIEDAVPDRLGHTGPVVLTCNSSASR